MNRKIVLTGAVGHIGRALSERLVGYRDRLILTDIAHYRGPIPPGAEFRRIDLANKEAVLALAPETAAVLHFGAISAERSFEEILGPNILGTYHVFELARLARARVIFASSNHVIGFHERDTLLDEDCAMRPDGFYGLSKAYGELMGRLYWDKHGVESMSIRIGSCLPCPQEMRHLSTWISYDDLVALLEAGLATERLGCRIVWGASANTRRWWRDHGVATLGCRPKDNAEVFAASLDSTEPSADAVTSRYQGGSFCSLGYSRTYPSPADIFEWMKDD